MNDNETKKNINFYLNELENKKELVESLIKNNKNKNKKHGVYFRLIKPEIVGLFQNGVSPSDVFAYCQSIFEGFCPSFQTFYRFLQSHKLLKYRNKNLTEKQESIIESKKSKNVNKNEQQSDYQEQEISQEENISKLDKFAKKFESITK